MMQHTLQICFLMKLLDFMDCQRALYQTETPSLLGIFGEQLWKKLGKELSFNSAYHPQIDGQTEVVNKSLGNLLRSLVIEHHTQWDQILPQAEFAYNDSPNRSNGRSPFQILYGMQPRGVSELRDIEQSEFKSVGAEGFTAEMQKLHSQIREQLQNSSQEYKCRVDQHIRELQFEVGDLVLAHLTKERFPRGTYNKLKMKNIRPCKILRKFEANYYELELPDGVGISPIFNIDDLYPYMEYEAGGLKDQPEIMWEKQMPIAEKPQMEKIIDQRASKNNKRKTYYEYLVKWKGHPMEDSIWISGANIQKHGRTVQELMDRSP
jgi:hypothetical protein